MRHRERGVGADLTASKTAGFGLTWRVLRLRRSELHSESVAAGGPGQAVLEEEDARTYRLRSSGQVG